MNHRAWALITVPPETRQYGGNLGHAEDYKVAYKYDTDVPNHKQLARGDLVVLRSKQAVLGAAEIHEIKQSEINKTRQKCPMCGNGYVKLRKTRPELPWRCGSGHEFVEPVQTVEKVMGFTANLMSYRDGSGGLVISDLKSAAYRPNDQLSIEEIDPSKIQLKLNGTSGEAWQSLFNSFFYESTISPDESDDPSELTKYEASDQDERQQALRNIKLRRGQPAFRVALRKRFRDRCVISGCSVVALLEAAHIDPYRGANSNHPTNGLLLRADLHTLFDLFLLSIDPRKLQVCLHPEILTDTSYAKFKGVKPFNEKTRPSEEALSRHWAAFQKTCDSSEQPET